MDTLNDRSGPSPAFGASWASIPTELLRAELLRRADGDAQPKCGSDKTGHYNTLAHVAALFLILAVSTAACGFPVFSRRHLRGSSFQKKAIFISQHFGTGVLMATAFVHLLPTAFTSLTDPCLPKFFNKQYRPLAGLIALVATLAVVAVESYLTTRGASHSHSHHIWEDEDSEGDHATPRGSSRSSEGTTRVYNRMASDIPAEDMESTQGLVANASPLPGSTPTYPPNGRMALGGGTTQFEDARDSIDDLVLDQGELGGANGVSLPLTQMSSGFKTDRDVGHSATPNPEERQRLLVQCVLLEAGILFHSIFIGMALSVATGPTFVVFLTAICLHQGFEGLALGTRIAAIHFDRSSYQPWAMVFAFGATTPIGQAIGLVIHTFYDPMSQTGLLMVGIMNAISSGLLLFAGLVQLLAQDFLSPESYKTLHGSRRLHAYLSVVGGAAMMAAVGAVA